MANRVHISYRGFWWWCLLKRNQHFLGLLEQQQQWRFLWIRLSCLNVSQICSAPPVEFVAKDGFAKFPDFGQFWRAASRRFRPLSHAPSSLPQTNFVRMRFQNCLHLLQFMWYFSLTLTIIIIIIITILKLDFVHAAQNYAHKLSLASQRADSHGHILSKSSTNLEKWGGVQKRSVSHIEWFICRWMTLWELLLIFPLLLVLAEGESVSVVGLLLRFICLHIPTSYKKLLITLLWRVVCQLGNKRICQLTDSLHLSSSHPCTVEYLYIALWSKEKGGKWNIGHFQ